MAQQDFGAEFDTVRNSAAFRLAYEEQLVRNVRCLTISQYADELGQLLRIKRERVARISELGPISCDKWDAQIHELDDVIRLRCEQTGVDYDTLANQYNFQMGSGDLPID